jgi:hypothetical protein
MVNKDGDIPNDDMQVAKLKLKSYIAGNEEMSVVGKFAKATRAVDGAPVGEETYIVPSRLLPPASSIVYGADKRPLGKVEAPDMIESQPVQNYGLHRPVMRGWRPKRPEDNYPDLGIKLMEPDQTYKLESSIPTEREMVVESVRNATVPYPATEDDEGVIPDPYRTYGMHVEEDPNMNGRMGDLGADDIASSISAVASSIAAGIKAKYGIQPTTPPPPAASGTPWGTILLVGGIGLAAVFILPKILK